MKPLIRRHGRVLAPDRSSITRPASARTSLNAMGRPNRHQNQLTAPAPSKLATTGSHQRPE